MNPTSILNYIAWHLGIRPEPTRSSAQITYMDSKRKKTPISVSSVKAATTREIDRGQGQP
jgi:hypothetical protein